MNLGIVFFVLVVLALIIVGFIFAFKSSDSTKNIEASKDVVVSPGNYCLGENSMCSEGYVCDSEEGICVKDE
jgi:hypothetical protein